MVRIVCADPEHISEINAAAELEASRRSKRWCNPQTRLENTNKVGRARTVPEQLPSKFSHHGRIRAEY